MGIEEPTSLRLAEACRGVLSETDCKRLATMPFSEAIDDVRMLLYEGGVEDPDTYLREKGILR